MKKAILIPIQQDGRMYKAGEENELEKVATAEQLQDWRKRDLIEGRWKGLSSENEGEDAPLEEQLVALLMTSGVERSEEEGAVEVLARVLRERDESRTQVQQLQGEVADRAKDAEHNRAQWNKAERERNEALQHREDAVKENDSLASERDSLRSGTEEVASSLSGALGLSRSSDETPLQFLQRVAREPQELLSRLAELRARVETEAQPTQGVSDAGTGAAQDGGEAGSADPNKPSRAPKTPRSAPASSE